MAMKVCPDCGEKYSDTYRSCPFCEEERALREGEQIRRSPKRSRRAGHSRQFSMITPTLIVLIILMAGLLIYLLYGDKMKKKDDTPDRPGTEEVTPGIPVEQQPEDPVETVDPEQTQTGVMPEDPTTETDPEPTTPDTPTQPEESKDSDYENAMKLSSGLSLSTEDFTLRLLGETNTIRVSGGSGNYKWISQDPAVASVDQNGKVTAVSNGTVNVVATDGSRKGVCIVRVSASGSVTPAPSTGSESTSASGLKAGAAMVVNGGNGVRVRSGPGTNYDILATVPNGADINVVESVGNDWYKINFSNVGGAKTTGYMKGEFLKNK